MNYTLGITVIVCTYNRCKYLESVLIDLLNQDYPKEFYDILVIDNNSTDQTERIVNDLIISHSNLIYYKERKIGLSFARNSGVRLAKYKILGFTDDDCRLPLDWLSRAATHFSNHNANLIGGPVYPFYVNDKPVWYIDDYATKQFGDDLHYLKEDEYLIGCNFFIQKNVIETIGFFDTDLGMNGKKIGYGEETELQIRVKKYYGNNSIYYDPNLFVKHLERPEQLTILWITKSFINKGRDNFLMWLKRSQIYEQNSLTVLLKICTSLFLILYHTGIGYIFRNRIMFKYPQNYHYVKLQGHWKRIGFLKTYLLHRFSTRV